jgi:hypothetical protein
MRLGTGMTYSVMAGKDFGFYKLEAEYNFALIDGYFDFSSASYTNSLLLNAILKKDAYVGFCPYVLVGAGEGWLTVEDYDTESASVAHFAVGFDYLFKDGVYSKHTSMGLRAGGYIANYKNIGYIKFVFTKNF